MDPNAAHDEEAVLRAKSAGLAGSARPAASGATGNASRHAASIGELAGLVGRPVDEVAAHYYGELQRLTDGPAVTDYLPVLAAKRVREMYRQGLETVQVAAPGAALLAGGAGPPSR